MSPEGPCARWIGRILRRIGFDRNERASCLVGPGDGHQACLQGRPRAQLGRQHEPAVVLAVAERPRLYLLTGQARFLHVPAAMTSC